MNNFLLVEGPMGPKHGLVALALALFAAVASAQSYGPGEQVLVVGAAEFRPHSATDNPHFPSGDRYLYGGDGFAINGHIAPLNLPDGALITQMCVYAYDPDPISFVSVFLEAIKLPAGGQSPGVISIPRGTVTADFDIGYGTVCSTGLSYVVHSTADLDGTGVENYAHALDLTMGGGAGFGGVRVFWHRQVSPPPLSPSFLDVPTDSSYYPYVEALAAAGITAGCGNGNFCPERPLTRQEMAVYLSVALGLHWPN